MHADDDDPGVGRAVERSEEERSEGSRREEERPQRRWWVTDEAAEQLEQYFAQNCSRR
jgi:hypothetical protein